MYGKSQGGGRNPPPPPRQIGLKENLQRPYPGKLRPQKYQIYNYRLSRARRVIENTFGVWSARFFSTHFLSYKYPCSFFYVFRIDRDNPGHNLSVIPSLNYP